MKPEEFYPYIGRIALIHAGLEHDIKGVLIEDWKLPEAKVENLYGSRLRLFFLECAEGQDFSNDDLGVYKDIIDRFWKASNKRNELIKASYGLNYKSGDVYRYDVKARGEFDPEMEFKEWVQKGGRNISKEELEDLLRQLARVREEFFQLSKKIYLEKAG